MIEFDAGWLRRILAVLGAPLGELQASHIRALAAEAISEASDLEFKESLYGASERNKQELCKDIAGMRNATGGVIVLGVSERQSLAADSPGVALSDAEERRMRQIVASGTAPYAEFGIVAVPDSGPERGFYLLVAPPSAARPHAVVTNEALRYPRRDGTLTRWLTEVEVADLYRDRFRGQANQLERLARIGAEATGQIELDAPWLVVSAVPNHGGSLPISFAARRELEEWMRDGYSSVDMVDGFILPPAVPVAGVGVERYTVTTNFDLGRLARAFYAECHVDGAAVAARRLNSAQGDGTVLADALVIDTAKCLRLLGAHALRAGAHSDATVHLQILGDDMRLGYIRDGLIAHYDAIRALTQVHSRHTLPLGALAGRPEQLFIAVRIMLGDIFNAFGRAEVPHIAADGALRLKYFRDPTVATWAHREAVATSQEMVEE
jgi:hypothetical protein